MIIILSRKWACRRRRRFMVHKEPVYFFCTRSGIQPRYSMADYRHRHSSLTERINP